MYAKVFRSLWDGTMGGSAELWPTFVFLLAHCDREGVVEMTHQAISARSGIALEVVRKAIAQLEEADPESRSREQEGRRLVRISDERSWGWRIVNYGRYRGIRDEEDRKRQNREAVKRYRDRKSSSVSRRKPPSASVSRRKPPSAHAEADAEAEAPEGVVTPSGLPDAGPREARTEERPGPTPPTGVALVAAVASGLALGNGPAADPRPKLWELAQARSRPDFPARSLMSLLSTLWFTHHVHDWPVLENAARKVAAAANPWAYLAPNGRLMQSLIGERAVQREVAQHDRQRDEDRAAGLTRRE